MNVVSLGDLSESLNSECGFPRGFIVKILACCILNRVTKLNVGVNLLY